MANNSANYNVNMRFTADTGLAKQQLRDLQSSIDTLMNQVATKNIKFFDVNATKKEIDEASAAVQELKIALDQATNVNTGRLDLSKFSKSLSQSGYTLQDFATHLENLGPVGDQAFVQLAQSVINAEVPLKRTNKLLDDFKKTLANTVKWQISSNIMHGVQGSIQRAFYYAEDLNKSLNEIRIVTGQNNDQMAKFAENANKAAQALSTTTTNYTNASLIYYQQGLSDKEVQQRTDVTIKMANAAGESASKVSDQLTAVWNNFYDGSKSLEYYADVMTKLGAYTASSTDEISEGVQKFASVANTIGLSYEYATSALATLTAKTRESADTVGNSLKTLFARIQGLSLGETLDDGTDLNKYSTALMKAGIDIKDQNGELKEMNVILDEMMDKWDNLSRAEQVALAQTVGGVRQYTQLINLMENKDYFKELVDVAKNSEGTLQEQADIYAESWDASKKRVQASLEEIYHQLVDDKFFIGLNDTLSDSINLVSDLTKAMGGLPGVLSIVSTLMLKSFGSDIVNNMQRMASNLFIDSGAAENQAQVMKRQMLDVLKGFDSGAEPQDMGAIEFQTKSLMDATQQSYDLQIASSKLNEVDLQRLRTLKSISDQYAQIAIRAKEAADAQSEKAIEARQTGLVAIRQLSKKKGGGDKGVRDAQTVLDGSKNVISNFNGLMNLDITRGTKTKNLVSQVQSLKLVGDEYKKLNDLANKYSQTQNKSVATSFRNELKNLQKQYQSGGKAIEQLTKQTDAYIDSQIKAKNISQSAGDIIKTVMNVLNGQAIKQEEAARATREHSEAVEKFNNTLAQSQGAIATFSQGLVTTFQGIGSLSIGINSIKGAIETLNNEDLSFGDKFLSMMTSASIALPAFISSFNSITTGIPQMGKNFKLLGNNILQIALGLDNIKDANFTAELDKLNKAGQATGLRYKVLNSMSQAWTAEANEAAKSTAALGAGFQTLVVNMLPVLGYLAAAAIAIGLLIKLHNQLESFTLEEQIKRSETAVDNFKSQLDEAKNKADQLKSAFDNYSSVKSSLDECTAGTKEWREQLAKTNEEALNILNTYPELKNIAGAWGKKDTGEIWVDESAVNKLQSVYTQQVNNLQYALANEQGNLNNLNIQRASKIASIEFKNKEDEINNSSGLRPSKDGKAFLISDYLINNSEDFKNQSTRSIVDNVKNYLKENKYQFGGNAENGLSYEDPYFDLLYDYVDEINPSLQNLIKSIEENTDATLQASKEASIQQALGLETMSNEDAKITTAITDANIELLKNSYLDNRWGTKGAILYEDNSGNLQSIGTHNANFGGSDPKDQALQNFWKDYLKSINVDENDKEYQLDKSNSVKGEGQNRYFNLANSDTKIYFSEALESIAVMKAMSEDLNETYAQVTKFQKNIQGLTDKGEVTNTVGKGIVDIFGNEGSLANLASKELTELINNYQNYTEDQFNNLISQSLFGKDFNQLDENQVEKAKSYISSIFASTGAQTFDEFWKDFLNEAGQENANSEKILSDKLFKQLLGVDNINQAIKGFDDFTVAIQSKLQHLTKDVFEMAGYDGVDAFIKAVNSADGDITLSALEKIADFDWTTGTFEDFKALLESLGLIGEDNQEIWEICFNAMSEGAKEASQSVASLKDNLLEVLELMNKLKGETINKEQLDAMAQGGIDTSKYYVQTGADEWTQIRDYTTEDKNKVLDYGIKTGQERAQIASDTQDEWNKRYGDENKSYGFLYSQLQDGSWKDNTGLLLSQALKIFGDTETLAKFANINVDQLDPEAYKLLDSDKQAELIGKIYQAYEDNANGANDASIIQTKAYKDAGSAIELNNLSGFRDAQGNISEKGIQGIQAWASANKDIEGISDALEHFQTEIEGVALDSPQAQKAVANFYKTIRDAEIKSAIENIKTYKEKIQDLEEKGEDTTEQVNKIKNEVKGLFNLDESQYQANEGLINKFLYGDEKEQQVAGVLLDTMSNLGTLAGGAYSSEFNDALKNIDIDTTSLQEQTRAKMDQIVQTLANDEQFIMTGQMSIDTSEALAALFPVEGTITEMCGWLNAMGKVGINFDTQQLKDLMTAFAMLQDKNIPAVVKQRKIAQIQDIVKVASQNSIVPNVDGNNFLTTVDGTTGSGGGGGSSKSETDIGKEIQDKRLAVSERKRDLLETKRADANPEDNAKYIKEEIELLEEEQQILEEQIKSWKTLLKTKVQEYNAKHPELKITLDDNGEIANASELWGKVWAEYEKNMNEGMSKEELNEWFQELSDDLNGPMGIQENIDENVAAIAEKEKEQAELELEAITKAIDWKVKQIDYEIKRLNYYQEKLLKQAHGNKQTIEAMLEGFAYQEQEMLQLFDKGATLREGIDQLNDAKSRYPEQSQIFDEQILEYQSDLIDLNESILDLRNDIEDLVQNVMDAALDEIDKQIDRLDTYTSMLDHLNNIIDLSGRSMLDMGLKTQIGATKVQTMIGKMKTLKEQMDGLNKASKEAQAALDDRRADNDESSVKYWENQVEVIKQEAKKASDEFLASWEETLQAAQELFEMRVELAINTLSNALSPFETLEDFQDKYEKAKTINDQYLDDAERLYELNKLNRQLNLQLNDTNDLLAKQKLREIQQEINDLQADGVQMSQYDLDYLQKKYDLQLAEIALMEQQNSKKSMRLVRDAAGNWTYAYDADEEKIEDATQKYEDAVHELDQLSKQYIDDVSEQLIQNQIEFKEALQDLDKNSADYSNQLLSLQEYYVERQRYLLDELNKGVENSGQTFHDTLYGQMTDLYDYNDAYMQFVDNSNLTIGELQTNYKDWQKVVEQAMNVAGTSWDKFGTDMGGSLDTLETHIQKLCDEIEELVNVLMGYISQSIGMVLDWEQKYSKRTDEELAKNEQYIDGNFTSSGGAKKADYWGVDLSDIAMRMAGGETTIVDKNGNVWTNLDQVKTARQEKLNDMAAGHQQLKNNSNSEYWTLEEQQKIQDNKTQKWLDEQIGKIQGADTGAYTGDWSDGFSLDNGKLIKVHPKELILNKEDTSNILKTVDIVRGLSNWIDKQVDLMTNSSLSILNHLVDANIPTIDKEQNLNQQVQIEANFPNVTDHYEIEEALSNLSNDAAQYISANKNK